MGDQIKKEINVMKMVKHRHVVNLNEVLASKTKIFIVLELVTGGELFDKIVAAGRFDEPTARKYFRQLMSGVDYCHRQQVCHRDLKPENLLLDENECLKISDFGLSALYGTDQDSTLLKTTCGTPNYVAPEVLADNGYSGFEADIWSCGVILYVLLAGFLPFDEPAMSVLFRKIMKGDFHYPLWFSPSARELVEMILRTNPKERATIAEIKSSAWYVAGGFTEEEERNESGTSLDPAIDDPDFGEALEEGLDVDVDQLNPQK
jgi:5'-AMP-activated protein kinase catalytic alpha subunit